MGPVERVVVAFACSRGKTMFANKVLLAVLFHCFSPTMHLVAWV